MPPKSPLWRIARRPAAAGRRGIRQRGDFGGILGPFWGPFEPQRQGLIVVSVRPCPGVEQNGFSAYSLF